MEQHDADYQRRLGARLRSIRQQQGLTLQGVEERSQGRWKAVVIGSYERGDRSVSVAKLAELADFYDVPITELLPEEDAPDHPRGDESDGVHPVKLDLRKMADRPADDEFAPIYRFARTIQRRRGDYNGTVLTIRSEDVRSLAVIFGVEALELRQRLIDAGLVIDA